MNKKKENDFLSEDELLEENSKNTEDNQNVDFVFKGTRSCFMLGPRTAEAAVGLGYVGSATLGSN